MGGAETKEISCGDYSDGAQIESDFEAYASSVAITGDDANTYSIGLLFVIWAEIVLWLFNLWTMNYLNAMNDILECGINNEIDSKYGKDYYDNTFLPIYVEMMDYAGTFDLLWHPGIHYSCVAVWFWWWYIWCPWCLFWFCCWWGWWYFWLFGWWFWGFWFFFGGTFYCAGFFITIPCTIVFCIVWWVCFWCFEIFYWFWYITLNYLFYCAAYGLPQMLIAMSWGTWWTEQGTALILGGGAGEDAEEE